MDLSRDDRVEDLRLRLPQLREPVGDELCEEVPKGQGSLELRAHAYRLRSRHLLRGPISPEAYDRDRQDKQNCSGMVRISSRLTAGAVFTSPSPPPLRRSQVASMSQALANTRPAIRSREIDSFRINSQGESLLASPGTPGSPRPGPPGAYPRVRGQLLSTRPVAG